MCTDFIQILCVSYKDFGICESPWSQYPVDTEGQLYTDIYIIHISYQIWLSNDACWCPIAQATPSRRQWDQHTGVLASAPHYVAVSAPDTDQEAAGMSSDDGLSAFSSDIHSWIHHGDWCWGLAEATEQGPWCFHDPDSHSTCPAWPEGMGGFTKAPAKAGNL